MGNHDQYMTQITRNLIVSGYCAPPSNIMTDIEKIEYLKERANIAREWVECRKWFESHGGFKTIRETDTFFKMYRAFLDLEPTNYSLSELDQYRPPIMAPRLGHPFNIAGSRSIKWHKLAENDVQAARNQNTTPLENGSSDQRKLTLENYKNYIDETLSYDPIESMHPGHIQQNVKYPKSYKSHTTG